MNSWYTDFIIEVTYLITRGTMRHFWADNHEATLHYPAYEAQSVLYSQHVQ